MKDLQGISDWNFKNLLSPGSRTCHQILCAVLIDLDEFLSFGDPQYVLFSWPARSDFSYSSIRLGTYNLGSRLVFPRGFWNWFHKVNLKIP